MTDTAFEWGRPFAWRRGRDLHDFIRAARQHAHRGGPPPFGRGFRHGGAFAFGGPLFGGGRRAGRGDVRAAVLALLAEQPMHGYQIIQELERRSEGSWRPSPGSVYPTLQQLQDEGLVRAAEQDGGRRVFELTEAGREEAAATAASPPWEDVAGGVDDDVSALRDLFFQVAAATWQVAQTGSSRQLGAAQGVLRDTRRRLYQLLAEDGEPTT